MTLPAQKPPEPEMDDATLLALVADGDCKRLTDDQRRRYFLMRCEAAGLDPRAQPFEYTNLNGKLVLYARKAATDQLSHKHHLSQDLRKIETTEGVVRAFVRISDPTGRFVDDLGCVSVNGLKGDALCNAEMKAVTKAGRRATLRYAGLGLLDETELETIPGARTGEGAGLMLERPRRKSEAEVTPAQLEAAAARGQAVHDAAAGVAPSALVHPAVEFGPTQAPPAVKPVEAEVVPVPDGPPVRAFTEKDRRALMAFCRDNGKTRDELKAFLAALDPPITTTLNLPWTVSELVTAWGLGVLDDYLEKQRPPIVRTAAGIPWKQIPAWAV